MATTFGPVWISSYGKSDDGTWQRILSDLSQEKIACGVEGLKHWQDKFPPNAIQFRKLCIEQHKIFSERKKNHEKFLPKRDKIHRDVELGKSWILKMKKSVKLAKPYGGKITKKTTKDLESYETQEGIKDDAYADLGYTR